MSVIFLFSVSHCFLCDVSKAALPGLTFREICSTQASTNKVACCHFSSDGKLLATGGHDKKVKNKLIEFLLPIICLVEVLANSN